MKLKYIYNFKTFIQQGMDEISTKQVKNDIKNGIKYVLKDSKSKYITDNNQWNTGFQKGINELFNMITFMLNNTENLNMLKNILNLLQEKYFDLVWYANKNDAYKENSIIKDELRRVEQEYIEDIIKLNNEEYRNYYHGINSAYLAGSRYITEYLIPTDQQLEDINEIFLNFDSDEDYEEYTREQLRKSNIEIAKDDFPLFDIE